jgi:serine/threonine protein kinase/peptidoglycan hydrolase-like protein with peptidoglycan-binding domain
MSGVANREGDVGQDGRLDVLPAGTSLRGYELTSILGQGAFGITYRARDVTLGRDVAIKEYLPTNLAVRRGRTTVLPRSPDHADQFAWGRERFLEEARTLARLDRTPAIVRVHDFLEDNGTAYMVMALIEGENLNKRLLREGRLAPEAVERLIFPLLDGLEEVHGFGFLHRDIKPANVMVDAHGRPTLIDFGAARAAMAGRSTTMTAIFTPGYAAFEQYSSAGLGPWTDIYGLSATLYHAIIGRIPPGSIDRVVQDAYEALADLKPEGYSLEMLAGIDAGMAMPAAERPQSIVEWRHVLRTGERQSLALEATQVKRKPGRLARAARRGRKAGITLRGPTLWGAAAAAVLVLAGGGYLAFTANQPMTTPTASLNLTTEQLEQVLAERRKADTLAAEKRKLEEKARQKAEADAEAKRQADAELEQARQARQKAEQELGELKARIEAQRQTDSNPRDQEAAAARRAAEEAAQRKAEEDAAALRQAEEEARKKAEAEAESKRQADEALAKVEAERQKAEQEARQKAEAEQVAMRQSSEEAQRKAAAAEREKADADAKAKAEAEQAAAKQKEEAEAAEKTLRLAQADRQRLQLALTSLGFDTRGNDGVFGPRSRDMIAGWQKKVGAPATGFVTATQRDQLLRSGAPGIARWEEEQKKVEQKKVDDESKKAGDAKAAAAAAPTSSSPVPVAPAPAAPAPSAVASPGNAYDGNYRGEVGDISHEIVVAFRITKDSGSGTIAGRGCSPSSFSATISYAGDIRAEGDLSCPVRYFNTTYIGRFTFSGRAEGRQIKGSLITDRGALPIVLYRLNK